MNRGLFPRAAIALVGFALAGAAVAAAQPAQMDRPKQQVEHTPFNYDVVNGQRVPKGNRVTNPDGSWRETIRQGNCTTVKEKSAAGEYKETRSCG
jgi:hypothetical protein